MRRQTFPASKAYSENFFMFLICMIIVSTTGCSDPVDVALNTQDSSRGLSAVEKLTDQAVLEKIVMEGKDRYVREAAVMKLTDQAILAKIALNLVERNDSDETTFTLTIRKLTDPATLAKIVLETNNRDSIEEAVMRLSDKEMMDRMADDKKDENVQLIYRIISAFGSTQKVKKNSYRITLLVKNIISLMSEPEVVNEVGKLVSITTTWREISHDYIEVGSYNNREVFGEIFECNLQLEKIPKLLYGSWSTEFPDKTQSSFIDAHVSFDLFLTPILARLPQSILTRISLNDKKGDDVRRAAIMYISDQAVLIKIALQDEPEKVCEAAVQKLTDQTVLEKIVFQTKHEKVCEAAVENLTDQTVLSKIAISPSNTDSVAWKKFAINRSKADEVAFKKLIDVNKLTDQTVLAKIAIESHNVNIRDAAVKKLTDQDALIKVAIATGDKDIIEKLTDQTALEKIALEGVAMNYEDAYAVWKLTDQAVLEKVACEAKDLNARGAAFMRLDQATLAKIAVEAKDSSTRREAIYNLTDQSALAKIIRQDNGDNEGETRLAKERLDELRK